MTRFAVCRKVDDNITHIVIPKNNSYNGNYYILTKYTGNIRPEILMSYQQLMEYFHSYVCDTNHKFKSFNNLKNRLRSINSNGISDFVILQKTKDGYKELDITSTVVMTIKKDYYHTLPISNIINLKEFLRIQGKTKYVISLEYYADNLVNFNNILSMFDEPEQEILMSRYKSTNFYQRHKFHTLTNKKIMNIAINMFGIKGVKIINTRGNGKTVITIDNDDSLMQFKLRYGKSLNHIVDISDVRI